MNSGNPAWDTSVDYHLGTYCDPQRGGCGAKLGENCAEHCVAVADEPVEPCTCPSPAVHDLATHQDRDGCYQPTVTPPADPFAGIPGAHRDESDEWF